MEETEDLLNFDAFFADAEILYLHEDCDGFDCPPPVFSLPPPPRPPWLASPPSCQETQGDIHSQDSCDNILIIDSQVQLEETFHNLIIVAVCSAVLVIILVFLVACIWR